MFCMKCGTKLPDDAAFCYKCGAKLPKISDENIEETETKKIDINKVNYDEEPEKPSNDLINFVNGEVFPIVDGYRVTFSPATCARMFFEAKLTHGRTLATEAFDTIWKRWKEEKEISKLEDIFTIYAEKVIDIADIAINVGYNILVDHDILNITKEQFRDHVTSNYAHKTTFGQSLAIICKQLDNYSKQLQIDTELNKTQFIGGGFGLTGAITGAIEAKVLTAAANSLKSFGKTITGNSDKAKIERLKKKLFEEVDWESCGRNYVGNMFYAVDATLQKIFRTTGMVGDSGYSLEDADLVAESLKRVYNEKKITQDKYLKTLCDYIEMSRIKYHFIEDFYRLRNDALPGLLKIAKFTGDYLYILKRVRIINAARRENIVKKYIKSSHGSIHGVTEHAVENQQDLEIFLDLRSITLMGKDGGLMPVFLLEGSYTIPLDKEKIRYIGLGKVEVVIESDHYIDFDEKDISFTDISFDSTYNKIVNEYLKEPFDTGKKLLINATTTDEYRKAYGTLNDCANNGDYNMKYQVAIALQDGMSHCPEEDVPFVRPSIERMLKQAANGGHVDACLALVKGDWELETKEIFDYLTKAEQQGSAEASYHLGKLCENGFKEIEGRPNVELARSFYQKAVDGGYSEAVNALAGLDIKANELKSKTAYVDACQYLKSSNYEEAIRCYKLAAEHNQPEALYELGLMYMNSNPFTPERQSFAKDCFKRAALQGYKPAVLEYAFSSKFSERKVLGLFKSFMGEQKGVHCIGKIGGIYCRPNIPEGKLDYALSTYAKHCNIDPKEVLVLFDDTFFGTAGDGFIITPEYLVPSYSYEVSEGVKVGSKINLYEISNFYIHGIGELNVNLYMYLKNGCRIQLSNNLELDGVLNRTQKELADKFLSLANGTLFRPLLISDYVATEDIKREFLTWNELDFKKKVNERFLPQFENEIDEFINGKINISAEVKDVNQVHGTINKSPVNDPEDYFREGSKYLNGDDVKQNPEEALKWFVKGAIAGHALCQYNAGYIYSSDLLGAPNYEKCKYWFTKAADNGVAEARSYLEANKDFFDTIDCSNVDPTSVDKNNPATTGNNSNYRCQFCGNDLQDGDTFCVKCGKKVAISCPQCGNTVFLYKENFCCMCGLKFSYCPRCHELLYGGQTNCVKCGHKTN